MSKGRNIINTVTAIIAVTVLLCAVAIMAMKLGVVDAYDFGAGAYYYADIPGYESIVNDDAYKTTVPTWVHIVLFLGWGWLMYRLWVWISRK